MRAGANWVGADMVIIMPDFIHDFGDPGHHTSMVRTCDIDEDGGLVRGTGPSDARYVVHECLDGWCFYPIQGWMRKWLGEGRVYRIARSILGLFWGVNCAFPLRDVANYFVWNLRNNPPRAVLERRGGAWIDTYVRD